MACLINSGYELGCRDNVGGISKVYIGNFSGTASYTFDANGDITATDSVVDYYTFNQEMEVGEFNQTGAYSTENGTVFFDQQLSLTFHKNDSDLRNLLLVLSQANLSAIIVDQRDQSWLMGLKNGVRAINGAQNTGKAFGDLNGVTITLQGKEAEPANLIPDTSIFTIN